MVKLKMIRRVHSIKKFKTKRFNTYRVTKLRKSVQNTLQVLAYTKRKIQSDSYQYIIKRAPVFTV